MPNDDADASGTTAAAAAAAAGASLLAPLPQPPERRAAMSPIAGPAPRGIKQGEKKGKAAEGEELSLALAPPPLPFAATLETSASLQSSAAEAT